MLGEKSEGLWGFEGGEKSFATEKHREIHRETRRETDIFVTKLVLRTKKIVLRLTK
jgi:hypothetical protein